jgi:hypothetical protein
MRRVQWTSELGGRFAKTPTDNGRNGMQIQIGVRNLTLWAAVLTMAMAVAAAAGAQESGARGSHDDLIRLSADWREFERPATSEGAPDYTAATLARKHDA